MSQMMRRLILFVCLVAFCRHVNALSLSITPKMYKGYNDKTVTITCKPSEGEENETPPSVLQITRRNDEKVLARVDDKELKLHGEITDASATINGQIAKSIGGHSFLTVTLKEPGYVDSGRYTCMGISLNTVRDMASVETSATLKVDMIPYLMGKLSDLELKLKDTDNQLKECTRKINDVDTKALKEMKDLRVEIAEATKEDSDVTKRMAKLKEMQTQQQLQFHLLSFKVNTLVAFSAGWSSANNRYTGEVIKFNDVQLNHGSSYNKNTGEFTAPANGVYVFHLTMMTKAGGDVHVRLEAAGQTVGVLRLADARFSDQGTISRVVKLNKNDRARILVSYAGSGQDFDLSPQGQMSNYHLFEGFLLNLI